MTKRYVCMLQSSCGPLISFKMTYFGISSNLYILNTTNIYHLQDSHLFTTSPLHCFIGLFDIFVECLKIDGTIIEGYFCTSTFSARFNKCCWEIGELILVLLTSRKWQRTNHWWRNRQETPPFFFSPLASWNLHCHVHTTAPSVPVHPTIFWTSSVLCMKWA